MLASGSSLMGVIGDVVFLAITTAFFVGYASALLAGAGLVWSARSVDANRSGTGTAFLDDLRLGWRTSLADPVVRGLAAVSAMAFIAVAWGGPIAPLLVREALVRGEPLSVPIEPADPWGPEIAYFVECVEQGRAPEQGTGPQARAALAVSLAAARSLDSGRPEDVS